MTTTKPTPTAFSSMIVSTAIGSIVLLDSGSYPGESYYLNTTWTFNGTDWTRFSSSLVDSSGPLPCRSNAHMTVLGSNAVLFGGKTATGLLQDTWTFNGTTWTKLTPTHKPPARCNGMMNVSFNTNLLFGGMNTKNILGDTWIWDGSDWTQASPTVSPEPRFDAALASVTPFTWLFGGSGETEQFNDMWVYIGIGPGWIHMPATTKPSARSQHAMTMDPANIELVMFGGKVGNNVNNETWVYHGHWHQKDPTHVPPARVGANIRYDYNINKIVMFGGSTGDHCLNDTWTWDGSDWTEI